MMTLTSALIAAKNRLADTSAGPWLWLLELNRDDTTFVRYAKARGNITWNSLTWTANNFRVDPPAADYSGSTKTFNISIQNVDQTLVTYLEADEILDYPAALYRVHADNLSSASNYLAWRGRTLSADVTDKWAALTIGSYDLRSAKFPSEFYSATRCRFRFKSDECGYGGGETTCDKRSTTCDTTMSNIARFGAFPTIPFEVP